MNTLLKNKWLQLCGGLLIVIFIYYFPFRLLHYNLDSLYDEGFLFQSIQAASNGFVDGMSLWPNITISLLPHNTIEHIYSLRVVHFLLNIVSLVVFLLSSSFFLYKKGKMVAMSDFIIYMIGCTCLFSLSASGIVICYNQWQQLWLISIISLFLLQCVVTQKVKYLCWILIGGFSTWSFFTILPSAVLVCFSIYLLLVFSNKRYYKLVSLACVCTGVAASVIIIHYCVLPIDVILTSMIEAANRVTTLNRGYDPLSFVTKILLYFRDYGLQLCMLLGGTLVSALLYKYINKYLAVFVWLCFVLCVSQYAIKPPYCFSTLCTLPIVCIWIYKIKENVISYTELIVHKCNYIVLFLFFAPLLCTIGTNVYLGNRMIIYIGIWNVLLWWIDNYGYTIWKKMFLCICLVFGLAPIVIQYFDAYQKQKCTIENSVVDGIYISDKYANFIERVDSILTTYNYQPYDTIWCTQQDLMTVSIMNGLPYGLYFQPMDFMARVDSLQMAPPYLFINDFDIQVAGHLFTGWKINEDYDVYYFDSPETIPTSYSTNRYLYCRKKK